MQYALFNGLRIQARPQSRAVCPHCGSEVVAKCGSVNIWHWSHLASKNCDPWFEPETEWRRQWKSKFGPERSEIRIEKGGAYHVADVLNMQGIVFEFQNSSISGEEIRAREKFYGDRMIWVINGASFKDNFTRVDEAYLKDWYFSMPGEFDIVQNYKAFEKGLVIEDWKIKQDSVKALLAEYGFIHQGEAGVYYLSLEDQRGKDSICHMIYSELLKRYKAQKPDRILKKENSHGTVLGAAVGSKTTGLY